MRSNALTLSRHVFCLIALFWAVSAFAADVPRETLERLADFKVEQAEIRHLNTTGKLSTAEYNSRYAALQKEATALWQSSYRLATKQEKESANTTLTGLTRTKLSLLEPRWAKEREEFRQEGYRQQKETAAAIDKDARAAAEFQRQRLLLQRQFARGTIDQGTFAAKDKEAQDAIEALRKPFQDAGGANRFDARLTQLTKAIADHSESVEPRPKAPATTEGKESDKPAGRGGEPDFDGDVKRAAEALVKSEEIAWKVHKKEGNPASYTPAAVSHSRELSRLRMRYQAENKLQLFEAAYTRMAAPGIQAIKLKYQPEAYRPPVTIVQKPPTPPQTDFTLAYWLGGGALGLGFLWLVFRKKTPEQPPVPPITDIHGTAKWAPHQISTEEPATVARGVHFGKSSHPDSAPILPGIPVTSLPEAHTLIVSRTRGGKGTTVLVPTLLRYASSMLVIDPKGENAAITARTRRDQLRQSVYIINPWGEMKDLYAKLGFQTATFNPLDAIHRNDPNAVSIAQNLAATICPGSHEEKAKFWQGSAADILAAVLLWVAYQPGETKTLARARELVTQSREDFRKNVLTPMMASTAFDGAIKEMISQYYDLAPETYSGIIAHLSESTKFLSDPQIKASTASSSFSMGDLRDVLMTVYLVIPHDRLETQGTWLRLIIAAATQAIKLRAQRQPVPPHRCMFLIDEFGSIGHIPAILRDIAVMAGAGLDFTLVVQGIDQLEHHYKEQKKTILNNCAYKWFCYINELETAKYLSESLGKKTVRTTSKSTSTGTSGEHPTAGESTSYSETGRPLLMPDEIMNLGRDVAILLHPTTYPQYLRPVNYSKLTEAYAYLSATHPRFYWTPPLTYDPNPYWHDHEKEEREKRERERQAREKQQRENQEREARERAQREGARQEKQKEDQQKGTGQSRPASNIKFTRKEAFQFLGLPETATQKEIRAKYNHMMKACHPDTGGSNEIARLLNAAKEVLLD